MRNTKYTTQLAHGTGLVNETLSLLTIYKNGMSLKELTDLARESDILSCKTDIRLKHIVYDGFYNRFMRSNPAVPIWLSSLRKNGMSLKAFSQILMIYCVRDNAIVFDTISNVLNVLRNEYKPILTREDVQSLVEEALKNGKIKWSESVQKKNIGYVRSTLADFDIIDRKGGILPYELYDSTILYLMYEQHFAGLSDMAIWELEEWSLFNLNRQQILDRIMSLSLKGAYIAQTSGELLTISWNYQSMEEFIDATL